MNTKYKDLVRQDFEVPEEDGAVHSFLMALKCAKKGMKKRFIIHLRQARSRVVSEMRDSEHRSVRKFYYKCFLLLEDIQTQAI